MKTFALAGNPNCGKTTLFNALTGSTAHVGNWPGVTVDKREGVYRGGEEKAAIVDLPGIYSLSPYTPEEVISRNFILDEKPDGIINIVDATNLERNLYLTTQILEMGVPVIIALNMMDEVEKAGDSIDVKALERAIGVPVVAISALRKKGIKELMDKALTMKSERKGATVLGGSLTPKIRRAQQFFEQINVSSPLFHAVKMLEGDEIELKHTGAEELLLEIAAGDDLEAIVADERYKYISAHFSTAKAKSEKELLTTSDRADKVLTHRIWGLPIFAVILFLIFHLTFSEDLLYIGAICNAAGSPLPTVDELGLEGAAAQTVAVFYDGAVFSPGVMLFNALDAATSSISGAISSAMESAEVAEWAIGLVCDGVLGGVFAVLGFLPQILLLFLFFSILEDSGYMARVAFILDRIFRRFGLTGRAFMPMIMGFGCSIPAMVNTRTLADERERTATVRVIPFFSCGAKLPILTAIAGGIVQYFGVSNVDLITFLMYVSGVSVAIISVLLMRATTLRGEVAPFIMELPAYHMPGFKNLMLHLWDKAKHFIKKAFTIILASTIIIWFLQSFGWNWQYVGTEGMGDSILASLGKFIQPLFTPLGFGSQLGEFGWVFAVAAVTGLIAKENVIATFSVLAAMLVPGFEGTEEGVAEAVAMIAATGINIPALLAFIMFNMTTIPCFAAVATAKAELPTKASFKWTLAFWVCASYIVASVFYTVGTWWWTVFIWIAAVAAAVTLIVLNNLGKIKLPKFGKRKA
ncbi:MAG: ferrous iron transporter B [Candidatus Coproplasma sp.]